MAYRLFDFSSDVGVEGEGPTPEAAMAGLAEGLVHVLTDGSHVEARTMRVLDFEAGPDWPTTAVAFLNELIFLFDTEQFLPAQCEVRKEGGRVQARLQGDVFDERRHRAGRGVKAATYHEAQHVAEDNVHRLRIVLDL